MSFLWLSSSADSKTTLGCYSNGFPSYLLVFVLDFNHTHLLLLTYLNFILTNFFSLSLVLLCISPSRGHLALIYLILPDSLVSQFHSYENPMFVIIQ